MRIVLTIKQEKRPMSNWKFHEFNILPNLKEANKKLSFDLNGIWNPKPHEINKNHECTLGFYKLICVCILNTKQHISLPKFSAINRLMDPWWLLYLPKPKMYEAKNIT